MKTQMSLPGMPALKTTLKGRKVQVRHVEPDPVASAPGHMPCFGEMVLYLTEAAVRDAARIHGVKVRELTAHATTTRVVVLGAKTAVMAVVMEMKGRRMLVRDEWTVTVQEGGKR